MTRFVVVAGAWLGAWAWDEVAAELRTAGHEVHALTLSGLAEKQGVPAGQQTHVQDVVDEVERLGLRDVVLVGHSYSGVPVGQAAQQIGDRLRRVVFVDANVPVDGKSFLDGFPSDHIRKSLEENGGDWPTLAPDDYAGQDLTDEQIARIISDGTAHPGATLTEPAVVTGPLGGSASPSIFASMAACSFVPGCGCTAGGYLMDGRLGLDGKYTRMVQQQLCRLAADVSFEKTHEHLRGFWQLPISAETIRHLCHGHGQRMQRWQPQEQTTPQEFAQAAGAVEFTVDAGKVNTREKGWKDLKIAVFQKRCPASAATPKLRDLRATGVALHAP